MSTAEATDTTTGSSIRVAKRRIEGISGVRLIAAILVFTSHSSTLLEQYGYGNDFMTSRGAWMFFVLSGFLYPASAIRSMRDFPTYLRKRAARIYPLYLLVFAAMAGAAGLGVVATEYELNAWNIISNMTLTQEWVNGGQWRSSINPPTWSLSVEVFSWLVMPAAYLLQRRKRPNPTKREHWVWLGVHLAALALLSLIPVPRAVRDLPFFFVGIQVRHLVEHSKPITVARTGTTVAFALILSGGWALTGYEGNYAMFTYARLASAVGFALLVSCITNAATFGFLHSRFANTVGGWSFSFFLLQTSMLAVYGRMVLHDSWPVWMAATGIVVTGVVAWCVAGVVHRFVEQPLTRRLG